MIEQDQYLKKVSYGEVLGEFHTLFEIVDNLNIRYKFKSEMAIIKKIYNLFKTEYALASPGDREFICQKYIYYFIYAGEKVGIGRLDYPKHENELKEGYNHFIEAYEINLRSLIQIYFNGILKTKYTNKQSPLDIKLNILDFHDAPIRKQSIEEGNRSRCNTLRNIYNKQKFTIAKLIKYNLLGYCKIRKFELDNTIYNYEECYFFRMFILINNYHFNQY